MDTFSIPERHIYTVSELTREVRILLEDRYEDSRSRATDTLPSRMPRPS
jgi:hypothetical protein